MLEIWDFIHADLGALPRHKIKRWKWNLYVFTQLSIKYGKMLFVNINLYFISCLTLSLEYFSLLVATGPVLLTVKSSKWCARNSLEIPTRLMRCRHFGQIKQHNIFIFFPEPCHQIISQTGATRWRCHNNVLFPWCQCDVRDKCPAPLPSFSSLHEIKCNAKEWHNTPNTSTVKLSCPGLRHSLIPLIYSIKL